MTMEKDFLDIVSKIVITFDICSSSDILEDLHRNDAISEWRDLMIWVKEYLIERSNELKFKLYQFTGDGWIILFDQDKRLPNIMSFLEDLSKRFDKEFERRIDDILEVPPDKIGLTFGMDRGTLVKIKMRKRVEYIGRALNVACRLQGAIKYDDGRNQYKALISRPLYVLLRGEIDQYKPVEKKKVLKNIAGGKQVRCMQVNFM